MLSTKVLAIPPGEFSLHQTIGGNINGRAIYVIVAVQRWLFFERFYARQNVSVLEYLLTTGSFGTGVLWSNTISPVWKENQHILYQLPLPTNSNWLFKHKISHYENRIFWNSIISFRFKSLKLKKLFSLWMRKGLRRDCRKLCPCWCLRSWKSWVDS